METKENLWRDRDRLFEEYVVQGRTQQELAEVWDCSFATINRWVRKHNLNKYINLPKFRTRINGTAPGYEIYRGRQNYEYFSVLHHRLLAVAEYGFENVESKHVHHKNGIPWDNRPDNIELKSHGEHSSLHGRERFDSPTYRGEFWYSESNLRHLYHGEKLTLAEIAEKFDVSKTVVIRHMEKWGIERYSRNRSEVDPVDDEEDDDK